MNSFSQILSFSEKFRAQISFFIITSRFPLLSFVIPNLFHPVMLTERFSFLLCATVVSLSSMQMRLKYRVFSCNLIGITRNNLSFPPKRPF